MLPQNEVEMSSSTGRSPFPKRPPSLFGVANAQWVVAFCLLSPASLSGCLSFTDQSRENAPHADASYTWFVCPNDVYVPTSNETAGRCNVRVTGEGHGPANGMTITVDPTDPDNILIGGDDYSRDPDPPCDGVGWLGSFWSRDGGFTWQNKLLPGYDQPFSTDPGQPLAGRLCARHPVAFWGTDGTAYYAGKSFGVASTTTISTQTHPVDLWVARSSDGGATYSSFGTIESIANGDQSSSLFGVTADSTSGNLYSVWTPSRGTGYAFMQVNFARSSDGGATWSEPQVLVERPKVGNPYRYPMVDVGPEGTVYVTWRDGHGSFPAEDPASRPNGFWLTTSNDGGKSWSTPHEIIQGQGRIEDGCVGIHCGVETRAVLSIDHSNGATAGRLYLAWKAFADIGDPADYGDNTDADVMLSWSDDDGASWSSPLRVNDDVGTSDQSPPWMDVGPDGDVHVVWYDLRDDPKQESLFHVYYAHVKSGDVGRNIRVTEGPIEFDSTGTLAERWIGVDEGSDGRVHIVWTDSRFGRADAFTATIGREPAGGTIGIDEPLIGPWSLQSTQPPSGLAAPVKFRFAGHVDVPYYCQDPDPRLEAMVRDSASETFTFEVPNGTRYLNGSLDWDTTLLDADDLDVAFYDSQGRLFDRMGPNHPETFKFELPRNMSGTWTAWVTNCENPPTDFTLTFELA